MTLRHRCILLGSFLATLSVQAQDLQPAISQCPGDIRRSGLPEKEKTVTLPLRSSFYGYLVEIQVNGKPVQLMLDTGSSRTAIFPEAAKRIGLNATKVDNNEGLDSLVDAKGKTLRVAHAVTRRIDLGGAWTKNEKVWIFPFPALHAADGLLGINTLADWDVRINPKAESLTLFPSSKAVPLKGEFAVPLSIERSRALWVPVWVGGQRIVVMPDTGYGGTLSLPSVLAGKLVPQAMKEALPAIVSGFAVSGEIVSRSLKIPKFTFGPDSLVGLPAEVKDRDEAVGLVGLGVLRHYVLTFDFSAGELRLKPLGTVHDLTKTSSAGLNLLPDEEGRLIIHSVIPHGPAAKCGLQAGDELLEIEGRSLRAMKREELDSFKQLPPGTTVKIRYRRGKAAPLDLNLVLTKK